MSVLQLVWPLYDSNGLPSTVLPWHTLHYRPSEIRLPCRFAFSEPLCLRRILLWNGDRGSPLPMPTDSPLNDHYFIWQTHSYLIHAHGPHTQTKRS